MKPEEVIKAIKGLENIIEYWTHRPDEVVTAKLAIQALEKQVAKKPRIINGGTNTCHDTDCCNDLFRWYSYCPVCGQAIDWSEEE